MKVTIEKNELVIRLPLEDPKLSGSGKTMVFASTHGNLKTDCMHPVSKKPITVGVNAYFKAEAK